MDSIRFKYDYIQDQCEKLRNEITALKTDVINASESDYITVNESEELDEILFSLDNAIISIKNMELKSPLL